MNKSFLACLPFTVLLLASCLGLALPAGAQDTKAPGKIADEQLFSYLGKDALPPGTLAWQQLRQVRLVETRAKDGSMVQLPEYTAAIKSLDKADVKIYGFVLPLSTGTKQSHFLLSPLPSHCPYCVDQGPDSMVEVFAKTPLEYNAYDPVVIAGKLELVNDQYLFYRLTNGEPVKK
jgi:hypothetical protein